MSREPTRIALELVISDRAADALAAVFDQALPILERIAAALERQQAVRAPAAEPAPPAPPAMTSPTSPPAAGATEDPEPSASAKHVWTARRLDLLRDRFAIGGDHLMLLTILNAQPGREIVAVEAMLIKARDLGLGDDVAAAPALFRPRPPAPPARPGTSAAAASNPARPGEVKWTAERLQLLATMREAGNPWTAIHFAVNKLEGEPISSPNSVCVKWYDLKKSGRLPAPDTMVRDVTPRPEEPPPPPPEPIKPAPVQPFSDERKAILKRMWARGEPVSTITANLNRIAGPKLSDLQVMARAAILDLRRPGPGVRGEHDVPATGADVRNWLRTAGGDPETHPTDEAACSAANAIRDRLQLPPFFLTDDVRGGDIDFSEVRGTA